MELSSLLQSPVSDLTWVAFDTEATGFSNVSARLVEIAGVRFRFVPPASPGETPIELLGTVQFPLIGELPYLLDRKSVV